MRLAIDVWSDIACPWCYVGKRRLETALAGFEQRDAVEVTWRSFELDPGAPRVHPERPSYVERLARKYGTSVEQAQDMIDRMTLTGTGEGIEFRFDEVRSGNTFDAHRLLHWAASKGLQDVMKERLLLAYMSEGVALGETENLVGLAAQTGLDPDAARGVLEAGDYAAAVRADEAAAARLGVRGVPFFVIGRYGISGAQPADLLGEVLERAFGELEPEQLPQSSEGAFCGPDGC